MRGLMATRAVHAALTVPTSVLDTNSKAHELDNLYVVDTSFFPSIGAVNPGSRRWRTRSESASTWSSGFIKQGRRACEPTANQREIATVYVASTMRGVALVTFPVVSAILTSPSY